MTTYYLFSESSVPAGRSNDGDAIEIGTKFYASEDGQVAGIQFYKPSGDTSPNHNADLWDTNGTLLATVTTSSEPSTGWIDAYFSAPVSITAGTTYIAAVYSRNGEYPYNTNYFTTSSYTNGPLTAPESSISGGNGVFAYSGAPPGGGSVFPNKSANGENFWAGPIFQVQTDNTATGTATFGPFTAAGSATLISPNTATGQAVFDPFAAAGSATRLIQVTGASTLGPVSASGQVAQTVQAAGNAAIGAVSAAATATQSMSISGAVEIGPISAAALFALQTTATGAGLIGPFTAIGGQLNDAQAVGTIGPFAAEGSASHELVAEATVMLPRFMASAGQIGRYPPWPDAAAPQPNILASMRVSGVTAIQRMSAATALPRISTDEAVIH